MYERNPIKYQDAIYIIYMYILYITKLPMHINVIGRLVSWNNHYIIHASTSTSTYLNNMTMHINYVPVSVLKYQHRGSSSSEVKIVQYAFSSQVVTSSSMRLLIVRITNPWEHPRFHSFPPSEFVHCTPCNCFI